MILSSLLAGSAILGGVGFGGGGASGLSVAVDYAPFRGLEMKVGDVALIEGSGFQYYERGWRQGYFSSAWRPIEVVRLGDGRVMARVNGADGRVAGTQTFTLREDGFDAVAEFRWRGNKPAMLEYTVGRLWAPLLADGTLSLDGAVVRNLRNAVKAGSTFEQRVFGAPARRVVFEAPSATVEVVSEVPIRVMDARNYTVDWALDKELFWLGFSDIELKPQEPARFVYSVRVRPRASTGAARSEVAGVSREKPVALDAESAALPLVPRPKSVEWGRGVSEAQSGWVFSLPSGFEREGQSVMGFVEGTWDVDLGEAQFGEASGQGGSLVVSGSVGDLGLAAGGYTLASRGGRVTVRGQDGEGLRNGLRTLGILVRPRGGSLVVPDVEIRDWPSVAWRGVHMFTGPTALAFQTRLTERVLGPMKLNKVVLQCERSEWEALPGIETPITISRQDLRSLVAMYRSNGFEFIPLVQSLGHMGWFFENGKNLDMAVNPAVPFTVDPRRARTRAVVRELWEEVIREFRPSVVHFGMDEIDMRGIPEDPNFSTRLWQTMMPVLNGIAREHSVTPMVWGDIMLGPGEAVDATHAKTVEEAKRRRASLMKGTYVADWHYKDDPNPDVFDRSLRLWKAEGMRPIASTWFRPGNIRGFTLSAVRNGAGVLQTTWAGFESSEANMVRAIEQFSAYILMADYAWSGRTEMPGELGYDPAALLQRLYFAPRASVRSRPGTAVLPVGARGEELSVGSLRFLGFSPLQLSSTTTVAAFAAPRSVEVNAGRAAREVAVALDCLARTNEMTEVGRLTVVFGDGTSRSWPVQYGMHVRALTDERATIGTPRSGRVSAMRVPTDGKVVSSVRLEATHSAAGLRLHAVTLL